MSFDDVAEEVVIQLYCDGTIDAVLAARIAKRDQVAFQQLLNERGVDKSMLPSSRTFLPWVGAKYESEGLDGLRLLVLGESHYGTPSTEPEDFTRAIVREWAVEKPNRFWKKIARLIHGRGMHQAQEFAGFWNSVVFCNYIQTFLPAPRMRPSETMWQMAPPALARTVEETKPDAILVLGKELGYRLQNSGLTDLPITCGINHPSSGGWSYAKWQPKVKAFLEEARCQKAGVQSQH